MRRFEVESPATMPAWARTGFYNGRNRTLYLPAAMAGPEAAVAEKAEEDAVGKFDSDGHAYVPSGWLATHYPATLRLVEVFVRRFDSEPALDGPPAEEDHDVFADEPGVADAREDARLFVRGMLEACSVEETLRIVVEAVQLYCEERGTGQGSLMGRFLAELTYGEDG